MTVREHQRVLLNRLERERKLDRTLWLAILILAEHIPTVVYFYTETLKPLMEAAPRSWDASDPMILVLEEGSN